MTLRSKWIAIAASLAALVVVGVAIFVWSSLDGYIARTIEREGTAMTGTRVEVASVDVSLQSGRGVVHSLVVANPKEFSSFHALDFGSITLTLDLKSLAQDVIVVQELRIEKPIVRVEINAKGLANLTVLQQNTERYAAGASSDDEDVKDLRMRRVVITAGTIEADATAFGRGKETLQLRPIELSDVGGQDGAPPDVVGKRILLAIEKEALRAVAKRGLQRAVEKELGGSKERLRSIFKRD